MLSALLLLPLAALAQSEPPKVHTPEPGNWTVDDCIMVKMSAQITILPVKDSNTTIEMDIVPAALATGHCDSKKYNNTRQQIDLTWEVKDPDFPSEVLRRTLNITFAKNISMVPPTYGVQRIEAYYETRHYSVLENQTVGNETQEVNTTKLEFISMTSPLYNHLEFPTPLNRSYMCKDIGALPLFAEINNSENPRSAGVRLDNATFTAVSVQLDAFRPLEAPSHIFQSPLDCSFRPSDIVPIVVGCALAGTVVLVLIAYLIGRRRHSARGYQSV